MIGSWRRRWSICASLESLRSSIGIRLLPIAEYTQQLVARLWRDRIFRQLAGQLDCLPHLLEVGGAAGANRKMRLEYRHLARGHRPFKILGHQLDHLSTCQIITI